MAIDADISDLFFNTDVSSAAVHGPGGEFDHWDEDKLRDEAAMFLACLSRLNVPIPSVAELLADFHGRI